MPAYANQNENTIKPVINELLDKKVQEIYSLDQMFQYHQESLLRELEGLKESATVICNESEQGYGRFRLDLIEENILSL